MIIAGPCSIENEYQLQKTTEELKRYGIDFIRGGCWKPRTRPNSFSGLGEEGLKIASKIRRELNVKFVVEVLSPSHVDLALKYEIDAVWIGARSATSPFAVEEIAKALIDTKITVFIKNPMCPDFELWLGGIERLLNYGVEKVVAVHRGFCTFPKTHYRNEPIWDIPVMLKRHLPDMKILCDPSHIAGSNLIIENICREAIRINIFDGFMVESHYAPAQALTDQNQQITPQQLSDLLKKINYTNHQ